MNTTTILLAAGKAVRMGKLKQLLPLGKNNVLGVTLERILASETGDLIVITGAQAAQTGKIVSGKGTKIVYNPLYKQGMSTSLRAGLKAMDPETSLIMVALADQPLVQPATYNRLIEVASASDKGITLPVYQGRRGNPILLDRRYFEELSRLEGDRGGRDLLRLHPDDILEVPVDDEGVVANINTPGDYEKIRSMFD